jgi:hypothetical protein
VHEQLVPRDAAYPAEPGLGQARTELARPESGPRLSRLSVSSMPIRQRMVFDLRRNAAA